MQVDGENRTVLIVRVGGDNGEDDREGRPRPRSKSVVCRAWASSAMGIGASDGARTQRWIGPKSSMSGAPEHTHFFTDPSHDPASGAERVNGGSRFGRKENISEFPPPAALYDSRARSELDFPLNVLSDVRV